MKRRRFLQTAFTISATLLLLSGCSNDELSDGQGEALPKGKYPLELTASGLDAVATSATRSTVDGSWEKGMTVGVKVESSKSTASYKCLYSVTPLENSSSASLTGPSPLPNSDLFWWNTSDENKTISAWWYYTSGDLTTFTDNKEFWTQTTQSSNDGYLQNDFLYAHEVIPFKERNNKSLTFYHQTAKVVINIRKKGAIVVSTNIHNVKINNLCVTANFNTEQAKNTHYGLIVNNRLMDTGGISPHKLTSPNSDVSFESGSSNTEDAIDSYEAIVFPQTITAGTKFVTINVLGTDYYYTAPAGGIELKPGTVHTFNITVGNEVTATISDSMAWDEGNSGSGSVELF